MVCCITGVDVRLVYMLSPTNLFVCVESGSVIGGCIRFLTFKYDGLFCVAMRMLQRRGSCHVLTCLDPLCTIRYCMIL